MMGKVIIAVGKVMGGTSGPWPGTLEPGFRLECILGDILQILRFYGQTISPLHFKFSGFTVRLFHPYPSNSPLLRLDYSQLI